MATRCYIATIFSKSTKRHTPTDFRDLKSGSWAWARALWQRNALKTKTAGGTNQFIPAGCVPKNCQPCAAPALGPPCLLSFSLPRARMKAHLDGDDFLLPDPLLLPSSSLSSKEESSSVHASGVVAASSSPLNNKPGFAAGTRILMGERASPPPTTTAQHKVLMINGATDAWFTPLGLTSTPCS